MPSVPRAGSKGAALWAVAAVACAGCFGQPEDQFTFTGVVHGGDGGVWPGAKVTFERDQGASEKGCSAFGPFTSVIADDRGRWTLDVIRQQTRGRLSDHRCIRASISAADGRRSYLVFPFTGDDVHAPPLHLWRDYQTVGDWGSASMYFYTLPDTDRIPGAGDFEYRAEVVNPYGRLWRQRCTESGYRRYCDFDARTAIGTLVPPMRASASQHVESYGRDPFGQLKATYFETRIESRPVVVTGFTADLPFTQGAPCDFPNAAGTCALTDGDPTPAALPPLTTLVEVDFGAGVPFSRREGPQLIPVIHELFLHGLWVDGDFDALAVEINYSDTVEWVPLMPVKIDVAELSRAQVSRDDAPPGLDVGPISLVATPPSALTVRKLRIHALQDRQTVPIKSLGEMGVY